MILIIGTLATIIGLVSFFVLDIPAKLKERRYALYLTPKVITLKQGKWTTIKNIQIVNNNPYPIYSVQLKILEEKGENGIENMNIKVASEKQLYEQPDGGNAYEVNLNGFVISGETKENKKWKRTIIYKINPNSEMDIQLTIPLQKTMMKIKLKVTNFEKEAPNILTKESDLAISFKLVD